MNKTAWLYHPVHHADGFNTEQSLQWASFIAAFSVYILESKETEAGIDDSTELVDWLGMWIICFSKELFLNCMDQIKL